MTVLETLKAARKLITPKGKWGKKVLARSAKGNSVLPSSRRAVCWCAHGAILKASAGDTFVTNYALNKLRTACHNKFIGPWNDNSTKREVLAAFDKAIAITS